MYANPANSANPRQLRRVLRMPDMPRAATRATLVALLAAFSYFGAGSTAYAGTKSKTADQLIDRFLEIDPLTYGGAEARVLIVLVNDRKQQRRRKVVMMSRRDGELRRTYIRFLTPADVSGTSFLGVDDNGKRTQHLHLPALGRTRRISSGQRNSRFVGTDYSYADMDNRDIKDSARSRKADAKIAGQACYVVEVKPKAKASEYSRIVMWLSQKTMLPLQMKYFDRKGREFKRFTVKEAKRIDGNWAIQQSKMVDLRRNHTTVMRLQTIKFRRDIPLSQFTVRALERE